MFLGSGFFSGKTFTFLFIGLGLGLLAFLGGLLLGFGATQRLCGDGLAFDGCFVVGDDGEGFVVFGDGGLALALFA